MISSFSRTGARAGVFSLVAMLCLSVACDDTSDDMGEGETAETTGGDGDGDGALSYAADIQPVWDDNCTDGCHEPEGVGMFLDLSGDSYGNVVGTLSGQATTLQLIEAGNAADSYLIAKLRNTQAAVGGSGGQMPGGAMAMPLPEATIAMIEQWANEGALP
jgi:hypothetical protein